GIFLDHLKAPCDGLRVRVVEGLPAQSFELFRRAGYIYDRAKVSHYIRDGGANDGFGCSHILERFCWIDELSRLIKGKGHHADIEPFAESRQFGIGTLAQPMQVWVSWE